MINLGRIKLCKIKRGNTDWWIHEHAVAAQNGKTYIGYVTDTGEVHVKEFDAKCSRAESRDVCLCRMNNDYADEHNAPGICVTESGKIVAVYTGHGKDHAIRLRITERPFDIHSFGAERRLPYKGGVTYAQISENTARHELWLFCRVDRVNWEFRYSPDEGETWSEPRRFLHSEDGGLYYFDTRRQLVKSPNGPVEQWLFAVYGHPRISADHTIRSGIFRADGELLKNDGTETGLNLFDPDGKLIDLSELDTVYAAPEGETVRLLDVAPTPPLRIAYAPFKLTDESAPDPELPTYFSATFKDGAWRASKPICKAGEFLAKNILDGSQTYLPGMAYYYGVGEAGLHKNSATAETSTNRIFIARFDGNDHVLESYLSKDRGESYEIEQVIRRIPGKNGQKIWRPTVPMFAQDNLPVYWHEGSYASHSGGWHCDTILPVEYDD